MKSNEVPDKIYIPKNDTLELGLEDFWVGHQVFGSEIEYIRTDAFIEKACEWLNENWISFVNYDDEDGVVYYWSLTDEFKKFMKGE